MQNVSGLRKDEIVLLGEFLWELDTEGTFPLSEKITAVTQSSHNAMENVPSVSVSQMRMAAPGGFG